MIDVTSNISKHCETRITNHFLFFMNDLPSMFTFRF